MVPAGGGGQTTVGTGLNQPFGVAIDVPTTAVGGAAALTATVQTSPSGGGPTGQVSFSAGGTHLGNATLTGSGPFTATLTTSELPAGTQQVTATYLGDATYAASAGSAPITVRVSGLSTGTTVSAAPPPAPDVFIADTLNNRVVKVPAGGGAQHPVGSGLNGPGGVAVDAAGDVFIADTFNNQVVKVPAGGGAQTTVGTGLVLPGWGGGGRGGGRVRR